jgi:uncharacterized membrane protein
LPGKTLEEYVKSLGYNYRVLRKVYDEVLEGKIRIADPNPPKVFAEYLLRPDYSAWLWTTIALIATYVLSLYLSDIIPQITYLRYVVGSILVLFLVGYVTVELLYPDEKSLSDLERLALSIGLSLAIVPLLGLILNYTPWGIRLTPVLTTILAYTILGGFGAAYRKYRYVKQAKMGL